MTNTDKTRIRLPNAYPDELFYSIVARYHISRCNAQSWQTKDELFGKKIAKSSLTVPSSIAQLSKQGINYQKFLLENTQYKFYTAFLSRESFQRINERITEPEETGIRMAALGQVQATKNLRFCPLCAANEYRRYGEMYWHRLHQTPGVFCCERHRCLLFNTSVMSEGRSKEYVAAEFVNLFPINVVCCAEETRPYLLQLTDDVRYVYENYEKIREVFGTSGEKLKETYLYLCNKNGFATEAGSLLIDKLRKAFSAAIPVQLLEMTGLQFDITEKKPWIISMCRGGRTPSNPLKHLIFSEFLCGSFQMLIERHIKNRLSQNKKQRGCKQKSEELIQKYREQWIAACVENGNRYISEIQKKIPSVYTWLNRNDKEWLLQNADHKKRGGNSRAYSWETLDHEYAAQIKRIADEIKNNMENPKRVSKTLLMSKFGRSPKQKLDVTLPETMTEIQKYEETPEEYRMRKVRYAAEKCIASGEEPTKWKIIRKAAIPDKYADVCWIRWQSERNQNG